MRKQFRFILVLGCLSIISSSVSAQFLMPARKVTGNFFRLGIKGGVTMATLKTEGLTYNGLSDFAVENLNGKSGYTGGIYMRLGRKIFIEPELLVSYKNGSFDLLKTLSTQRIQFDVHYTSLDLPIMLGYRLGPLHVMAGPVASYSMSSDNTIAEALGTNLGNLQSATSKAYFSYTAGAGIDLLGFTLDLRYEGNVTDLSKTVPLPTGLNFSQKASLWHATLGMKIL
ncbi:MAG: porin family protein [Bacteroidota bacterium]